MQVDARAMIDAIVADPADVGRWRAYAEWLVERGDPRGELIQLELAIAAGRAAADAPARVRALLADEDSLLSPRLRAEAHHWQLALRRGFIDTAQLAEPSSFATANVAPTIETIEALFADPHAGLLATLRLRAGLDPALLDATLSAPRTVHDLAVSDLGSRARHLASAFPQLARLALSSSRGAVEELAHPGVQGLTSYSAACPAIVSRRIDLPALASLAWSILPGDPVLERGTILDVPPPSLAELILRGGHEEKCVDDDVIDRLAERAIAGQLRALTIGWIASSHVEALCARRSAFPALAKLDLAIGLVRMTTDELAALRDQLERAFSGVELVVSWSSREVVAAIGDPPARRIATDAESRRLDDGRIDAVAAFTSRGHDGE